MWFTLFIVEIGRIPCLSDRGLFTSLHIMVNFPSVKVKVVLHPIFRILFSNLKYLRNLYLQPDPCNCSLCNFTPNGPVRVSYDPFCVSHCASVYFFSDYHRIDHTPSKRHGRGITETALKYESVIYYLRCHQSANPSKMNSFNSGTISNHRWSYVLRQDVFIANEFSMIIFSITALCKPSKCPFFAIFVAPV